ncbi:hypothetical protein HN358_03285 [Candidatus Uhrbacteria bacterium]|jgi:hypothetical protein|nr:hypothetical protein [Candidatus Uhrbacteria bacterium]MBT7717622.1 hypothetical protein [Candidatus Uhrbacteria bacterium]
MKMRSKRWRKTKKATVLLLALFMVFGVFSQLALAATAPPRIISYQGRILNSNGVPISDTSVDMVFKFFDGDDAATDTCIWSNSSSTCATSTVQTVTLTDGLYSEDLGDTTDSYAAITADIFGDNGGVYLQVTIEGEALTPLKQFTAVPYASNADTLDGVTSASFFQLTADNTVTGTNNFINALFTGATPLTFDGLSAGDNLETSFAFADPTANRTITFKDESGTVAFLGDAGWTDGGAVVALTTSTDDIAVGGATAAASTFGVSTSTDVIYFGDTSADPTLTFQDSSSGTASLAFSSDNWTFSGADIIHSPTAVYSAAPGTSSLLSATSTVSAAAIGGAGEYYINQGSFAITNTAVEGAGETYVPHALIGGATNSSTGTVQNLVGVNGSATNSSTAASAVAGSLLGIWGQATSSGAGATIPVAAGIYGGTSGGAGTVTDAYGVWGTVSSTGTIMTRSYGGDFSASAGVTRYGVRGNASGGTNNYAGYFYGSAVHVDSSITPSTAGNAIGAGDLYVYDQLEVDGAGSTSGKVIDIENSTLTSGSALYIVRDDSGTDMTGSLAHLAVDDVGSGGTVLNIQNGGTGASININQLGDQIPLVVSANGTTDYIATFTNGGNADTNMGIKIQACLNTNPTTACNFLALMDGDGLQIGAIEGNGGGVSYASPGSDYAELFPGALSSFTQGDVIGLDSLGNVALASDSDKIIGAYSVSPNTLGNWFDGWQDAGTHVPVALLGQVPVTVNMEGGAILPGDYVTLSATTGVAKKATGVGYVLGQALESHSGGTGAIQVYIKPTWQAVGVLTDSGSMTLVSDDLALGATGNASVSTQGMDSYGLMLRGSGWDGTSAQDVSLGFVTHVTDASEYKLSIEDEDSNELAFVNQDGDLALSGRLYPSDQGVLQTDKYIYYDGSTGLGGDFMRTNASGWGSGSYDFAEMFPSIESVAPGEVVVFSNNKESVMRSTGVAYDDKIAGIVSTQPGFLAGENIDGHVPIALAGRVPTYVSGENGAIQVGDPLTTSSMPGYAMKATSAGPVVGYAMDDFAGDTGSITVFVRPSYYDGQDVDISDNSVTSLIPTSSLDLSGVVNLNGGSLISVSSLSGIGDAWSIDDDGTFRTGERFVQEVESYGGETIETYAVTARETTIQLSGTIELDQGRAHVFFDDFDESFADVVSLTAPYRVFLTAHNATGSLYALNRENDGFIIRDTEGVSHVNVDWLVIAYHKDFEPEEEIVEDNIADPSEDDIIEEEAEEVEEVVEEEVEEVIDEIDEAEEVAEDVFEDAVDSQDDETDTDEEIAEEETQPEPADPIIEEVIEEPVAEEAVETVIEQLPEPETAPEEVSESDSQPPAVVEEVSAE